MTTQSITITTSWQQVTDGTLDKTLQVLSGVIQMVDADTAPSASAVGHVISGWVSITAPTKAWVRATGSTSALAVIT